MFHHQGMVARGGLAESSLGIIGAVGVLVTWAVVFSFTALLAVFCHHLTIGGTGSAESTGSKTRTLRGQILKLGFGRSYRGDTALNWAAAVLVDGIGFLLLGVV
jgi:hypothetical protein